MEEIKQYKCPCCGGAIEFDSDSQKLKCPYCDSEFEVEVLKADNETENTVGLDDKMDGWNTASSGEWSEKEEGAVRSYLCQSCGGEVLGDATLGATTCPFCGNNVIINGQFTNTYKPDLIIPFKLDKKAAKEAFTKHLSNKKLLPKLFRSDNHIDEIKGVYVPFWLYNADVKGSVKFKGTKVRFYSSGEYDCTETKYYDVFREGCIGFHDIPVDGSSKMPDDLMDSLEPYDLGAAVDFNTAYFAGYLANKYDVTMEDNIPRINCRVKQSTEEAFRKTVTDAYQSLTLNNSYIELQNGHARYVLLPVWILNTTWNGEKYVFAMNGQTGKFVGNLPMDKQLYRQYWWKSFLISAPFGFLLSLIVKSIFG